MLSGLLIRPWVIQRYCIITEKLTRVLTVPEACLPETRCLTSRTTIGLFHIQAHPLLLFIFHQHPHVDASDSLRSPNSTTYLCCLLKVLFSNLKILTTVSTGTFPGPKSCTENLISPRCDPPAFDVWCPIMLVAIMPIWFYFSFKTITTSHSIVWKGLYTVSLMLPERSTFPSKIPSLGNSPYFLYYFLDKSACLRGKMTFNWLISLEIQVIQTLLLILYLISYSNRPKSSTSWSPGPPGEHKL